MGFCAGEVVVAPGCGVGIIEDVEGVEMGAELIEMYRIIIESIGVRMWVPTSRAVGDGIRRPIEATAIDEVFAMIRDTVAPKDRKNWNRRQRRYRELLMSNDPLQIAELLGELASVAQTKTLSFGERQMFERARGLLEDEFRAVCGDTIGDRMEIALAA